MTLIKFYIILIISACVISVIWLFGWSILLVVNISRKKTMDNFYKKLRIPPTIIGIATIVELLSLLIAYLAGVSLDFWDYTIPITSAILIAGFLYTQKLLIKLYPKVKQRK